MATILVTGGAGYIGAHTCRALAAAGHTPVTYDNLVRGHRAAVKWGPFEAGDVGDGTRLDAVFAHYAPAAVIHLAAASEVAESVTNPLRYFRVNVSGTINLLERALANGVSKVVFSSTCAVYGVPQHMPMDEDLPHNPINPYGRSKAMVEVVLQEAALAHGLDAVALRYFNAAGASKDGDIGEDHDPETHLIPLVLMAAKDPSRTMRVFGTDYPTDDGSCVRDFIHVDDLAGAHVSAVEKLIAGDLQGFHGLNLGTGRGCSVLEILAAAERITGSPVKTVYEDRRPGDPPHLVADPRRAAQVLGWTAQHSDLDTIIKTAWRWTNRT